LNLYKKHAKTTTKYLIDRTPPIFVLNVDSPL